MERLYTKDEVDVLLKKAIVATVNGMSKWIESDNVFITSLDGLPITQSVEINSVPNSVNEYVLKELKENGINIIVEQ